MGLASSAAAANDLRQAGSVVAVDLVAGELTIDTPPTVFTVATDPATTYQGDANALADFAVGDLADVRYQFGVPSIASRIDKLPPVAPHGLVIDLDIAPGTEVVPAVRVYGDDAGERFGGGGSDAIAFGDVNGDGFDDMIIGAYVRTQAGAGAGAVDIIYGGADLPGTSVDLNTDGGISVNGETRIQPSVGGQLMGVAVASGDIDGDGIDDIVIGSPAGNGDGLVHIVYGDPGLPGTALTLDPGMASSGDTLILGQAAISLANFGQSLAVGDLNADGFGDVIVGSPVLNFDGRAFVVYGGPALRGTTIDLDTGGSISPAGETRIVNGGETLGNSVATGDVNGDGIADAIIGAWQANAQFTADRGAVYVIYGRSDLDSSIIDLATPGTPALETRVYGTGASAWFGTAVASGDVDSDGFDDLLVAAGGVTVGDNLTGEVYVIYGSASLPGATLSLSSPAGSFGETRIRGDDEGGSSFGHSVALADVNGDGNDDLVLGATTSVHPLGSVLQIPNGVLHVVYGTPALRGQDISDIRDITDVSVLGDNFGDAWGAANEAGGDLDRDGVPEYAAAALGGDNPSIGGENASGYVVAISGQTAAPGASRIEHSVAADSPPTDFGPVVRVVLDHSSGLSVSTDTVSLVRNLPPMPPTGVRSILPVHWVIATDRVNFTSDMNLTYTDTELGMARESSLVVFTSPTGQTGTWISAGTSQTRDLQRNRITVHGVDAPGVFALVELRSGPRVRTRRAPGGATAATLWP